MASTYKIPGQNLTLNIPDEGQIFRGADPGQIYRRVGNNVQFINDPFKEAYQQGQSVGQQHDAMVGLLSSKYGIDYNSLPSYNEGDVTTAVQRLGGTFAGSSLSAPDFFNIKPTGVSDSFVQSVGSQNAQGYDVSRNGTNILTSPTIAQNQANANVFNASQSAPKPVSFPSSNLQPGMQGDSVKQLQDYLVSQGYMTQQQVNTGYGTYGPQTTAAVAALQKKLGVDNSTGVGYFGPRTISALGGQGSTPSPTLPDNINSGNMSQSSEPDYTSPSGTQSPDVAGLNSDTSYDTTLGPEAQKAQDLTSLIQSLNTTESGKAAYQAGQEQAQGIPELTRLQNDLSSQLKVTQLEAANIQQQTQQGQGVTTAIDQRQRAEALRLNSVKALGIYAQLEMAKGNLATAQDAVTKAVDLKFAPTEAAIAATKANLDLILSSPQYSLEEKNRALQQQDIQNAKSAAVAQAKQDMSTIMSWIPAAQQNGASAYVGQQLMAIATSANPDLNAAFKLYAPYAADKNATAMALLDLQYKRLQINSLNANTAQTNAETKAMNNPSGTEKLYSGLSSQDATAVRARVNSWDSEATVKNFNVVNEGYNTAKSLSNTTTNPADDQALIYAFAKIMDPNSVVRESEYATVQKYAQSWVSAYGKSVTQALNGTGFLSQDARKNIKKTLESRYNASKTNYDNVYKQYVSGINSITGKSNGGQFIVDYSKAFESSSTNETVNSTNTTFSGLTATIQGQGTIIFPNRAALDQFKKDNNL